MHFDHHLVALLVPSPTYIAVSAITPPLYRQKLSRSGRAPNIATVQPVPTHDISCPESSYQGRILALSAGGRALTVPNKCFQKPTRVDFRCSLAGGQAEKSYLGSLVWSWCGGADTDRHGRRWEEVVFPSNFLLIPMLMKISAQLEPTRVDWAIRLAGGHKGSFFVILPG